MKRIYKRWTIKDIEYLRSVYPVFRAKVIAEQMGLEYDTVAAAIRRHKISKNRIPKPPVVVTRPLSEPRKFWTIKEQEYVRANYHTKTAVEIAETLKRSRYSVYNFAAELGITKYNV